MRNAIYCPVCKCELVVTHRERYEDMSEHASNPNGTPSMKDGYQCTNFSWCEAAHLDFAWISDGDCYTRPPEGITYTEANKRLEELSVSGMNYALNSWNHYYHLGKNKIKERKISFSIGKYKIDLEPQEKGYEYPIHQQYMPSTFRWRYQIWKRSKSEGCYTSFTPDYRMIKYSVRSFNSAYKSAVFNNSNRHSIKSCMDTIDCLHWGTKDDRRYAKISSLIVRLIYPGKCRVIRELNKNSKK